MLIDDVMRETCAAGLMMGLGLDSTGYNNLIPFLLFLLVFPTEILL